MKRILRLIAVVAVLGIVAAAWAAMTMVGATRRARRVAPARPAPISRAARCAWRMLATSSAAFDPQKEYYSVTWEYFRCCLLRTLVSYKGVPTAEGGTSSSRTSRPRSRRCRTTG